MATMIERKCARCKAPMTVRKADVARGWGRFCSKSCKAIKQEQRTGQFSEYKSRQERSEYGPATRRDGDGSFVMSQADLAAGGYGDADWNTPFGDGKY